MPRVAEVKTEFTGDGAKVQHVIRQLDGALDRLANKASKDTSKKLMNLFSVGAVMSFVYAIDRAVERMGELVDKIREGKDSIDKIEARNPAVNRGNLAFGAEYSQNKEVLNDTRDSLLTAIARGLIVSTPVSALASMFSDTWGKIYATALHGDLGQIGVAEMESKLAKQKEVRDKPKETRSADKIERVDSFKASFSNLQKVGAFAYESDGLMRIQQQSLQQLIAIRQLIAAGRLNTSTTGDQIFPK